jgi:hypothetical protein
VGDFPHFGHRSAGIHFHDADYRLFGDGSRASLTEVNLNF